MTYSTFQRFASLVLIGVVLSACGYRLAGTADLPEQLQSIYLVTRDFSQAQEQALRRSLENAGAELVEQSGPGAVTLAVSLAALSDRQLVSSASSGTTVNRLSRSLDFSVSDASGEKLAGPQTLSQQQDIELNDDSLLSSNREKETAIRQMEQSLYQQLVQQLTRI